MRIGREKCSSILQEAAGPNDIFVSLKKKKKNKIKLINNNAGII